MKKRYRSISMENGLPVGTIEADAEEDLIIHNGNHNDDQHQSFSNTNEMEDNEVKTEGFNSMLIPIEEKLPSELSDTAFVSKTKVEIIQARAERNDALLLARHYRNVAEKLKVENEHLQWEMKSRIIEIKKKAIVHVDNMKTVWRKKIEGSSRSSRILRAALLRK